MTLREQQSKFTKMVGQLIQWATLSGYELTFGEAWRPPQMCQIYADQGKGIKNSLHADRLAVDFNLFKDGKLLGSKRDYQPLGEFWESLGGCWGGRFATVDSNHFSFSPDGVRK